MTNKQGSRTWIWRYLGRTGSTADDVCGHDVAGGTGDDDI